MATNVATLRLYDTFPLFKLESRAVGTITLEFNVSGNSLLSSVYIKDIPLGGTLKVNYFDTTTGASDGERFDLTSHLIKGPADIGVTDRITITRLHNSAFIEAIVTGGAAEFGVYTTVVSDFAVDLANAVTDGQTVTALDKAIPMACKDGNDWKFVECDDFGGSVPGTPTITNKVVAVEDIEESHSLTANTKKFIIRNRNKGKMKLAFTAAESGTKFITIPAGASYTEDNIEFSGTLYFQTTSAPTTVEILEWS